MSLANKLFGNLVPTITFRGEPAKIGSLEFIDSTRARIVVRLHDGRAVEMDVAVSNMRWVDRG